MRRTAPLVIALLAVIAGPAASGIADGGNVIYSSIPNDLPGNVASVGYQATQTAEFGDAIRFVPDSRRTIRNVTVVLSSWGCESGAWYTGDCSTSHGARFSHPITLNLYDGTGGTLGSLLASKTRTFAIKYRPSTSAKCDGGRWYSRSDKSCYNGLAVKIRFNFGSNGVTLPDEVIWGVVYNTSNYGPSPIGPSACSATAAGCGYDSLNVGAQTIGSLVGTDLDPEGVYWNTSTAGNYCDGGLGGVGIFRSDTAPLPCGWESNRPMAEFKARGGHDEDDDDD